MSSVRAWAAVRWARLRSAVLVREARSVPTLVLVAFCVAVCIPLAILLTPDQQVVVAGQRLAVGARQPSLSLSGPPQLVQVGNTEFDIVAMRVYGPLRPRLTLGPVQRNAAAGAALDPHTASDAGPTAAGAIAGGFLRWYGWASVVLLGLTLAACAAVGCVRMLLALQKLGRADGETVSLATLWQHSARQLAGSATVAVVVTMLAWSGAGFLAYSGTTSGLRNIRSLSDLVGSYHLSPSAVGPTVRGFDGAVIGDSRAARLGGPALSDPTPDDVACARSADSLSEEISQVTGARARNLACSGASISRGLMGPQAQGGRVIPPQVGVLKQMVGLRFVVVMVGPNDLYWTDFLRYCFSVADCQDNLTQGEFGLRLAAFDRDYGDLLQDLNDLPARPQIVVVLSYDLFGPDDACPGAVAAPGRPALSVGNRRLLSDMNRQLNDVLTVGAKKYQFDVAEPRLSTLCQPAHPQLGRDLQGLNDPDPFHPTAIGEVRLAASVARVIKPLPGQ
jgi:lysophospholipase L1-like esterase